LTAVTRPPRLKTAQERIEGQAMKLTYTVAFEKGKDGYTVTVPSLPGVVTCGATIDEARRMAADAIRCHVESLVKDGEAVPVEQAVEVERVEVELLTA
jgi:predicted RNase H-like HicB family nuclease